MVVKTAPTAYGFFIKENENIIFHDIKNNY